MSESVKIGGIGKNPIIDKINRLNSADVKSYVTDKMENILLTKNFNQNEECGRVVPLDFSGIYKER